MSERKIIKDDLRYLIFSELYRRFSEPKTCRKAFAILETAIECFDKKGFEVVTLTMIARESGHPRQLVSHYFEDLGEIRELTLKYIRLIGQQIIIGAIQGKASPDQTLKAYLEAHKIWAENYKRHLRVWLSFLSSCSKNFKDRAINRVAVEAGTRRLVEIIEWGKKAEIFKGVDSYMTARVIQTLMLGWLVTLTTEENSKDMERLSENVIRECLNLAESINQ